MRMTRSTVTAIAMMALTLTFTACNRPEPTAPKTGKVTDIAYDARSCHDEREKTVQLTYRPAGSDKYGSLWPLAPVCVTPETAAKYKIGDKYP